MDEGFLQISTIATLMLTLPIVLNNALVFVFVLPLIMKKSTTPLLYWALMRFRRSLSFTILGGTKEAT